MTALTASLGFLSFLAGPIPIVRDFGVAAAVGVMGGWLLTFGLIPVLAMLRRSDAPRSVPPAFALGNRVLDRVLGLAHGHPGVVLATGLVAVGISAVGMTRLVADSDTLELLGERDYMAQSVRFIRERLGPAARIDVVYELPPGGSLADPEHLRRLERVEELLLEETRVEPVLSVLPILRLANRELTGGPFEVPADRLQAAQLLLLVESAAPEVLHRVVTPDGRMAHLAAPHVYGSASAGKAQLERLRAQVGSVLDGHAGWWITGGALLSSHIGDLILENQLASFSTAFLTIFAVIFVFVRSFPLGALGMIPNVLPVVVVLGLMGLLDVKLDVATAMIASIVLGVSVDDTVYFLLHFQRARGMGASVPEAVSHTFALAGKPALFCAIVLALGFFVLGLSNFQSLAYFGLFSALAVLVAAVAELFLLPALLALTAGRRRED